jgi:hypothetical protein
MSGWTNGHWVRTRTDEGAKAFADEQRLEKERHERAAARSRARRAEAVAWVRAAWRRLRRS